MRLPAVCLLLLGELEQLFVVAGLVICSHFVVSMLLVFVHVSPLGAHVLHDVVGGPLGMLQLQLLPELLAEVDVGGEGLLGPRHFPLGPHVRAHSLFKLRLLQKLIIWGNLSLLVF